MSDKIYGPVEVTEMGNIVLVRFSEGASLWLGARCSLLFNDQSIVSGYYFKCRVLFPNARKIRANKDLRNERREGLCFRGKRSNR